ncbi:hypothetical protein ACI79G_07945 [Geodermatophilus sp. SYSU D00779]
MPLLRLESAATDLGGGRLLEVPFDEYNDLMLGAFEDARSLYLATAPVFFESEVDVALTTLMDPHQTDFADLSSWAYAQPGIQLAITEFEREVARVHAALCVTLPHLRLPDPKRSIGIYDVRLTTPVTITEQGHADQELLFHAAATVPPIAVADLQAARQFLAAHEDIVVDVSESLGLLINTAEPALEVDERLTIAVLALEGLLLPDVTRGLTRTFARRVASLLAPDTASRGRLVRLARELYNARSRLIHGDLTERPWSEMSHMARSLLARAIVEVSAARNAGLDLERLTAALDAQAYQPHYLSIEMAAPYWVDALRPRVTRGIPPLSGGPDAIIVPKRHVVAIAPLIRLVVPIDERILQGDLPLTWVTLSELRGLEDPDIRRDWVAAVSATPSSADASQACIALYGDDEGQMTYPELRGRMDALARWRDLAVVALRMIGLTDFIDPELLGEYAVADGQSRLRWPSIYRQTVLLEMRRAPEELPTASIDRLLAIWRLLKSYETGSRHEQVERVLDIYRRAHFDLVLNRSTQAQLLFACMETMTGRLANAADLIRPLVQQHQGPEAKAMEWFLRDGLAVRNAVAHGYWDSRAEGPRGGSALSQLWTLVTSLVPQYLAAWIERKGIDPAAGFQSLMQQCRVADLPESDAAHLAPRYAGFDAAAMTRQGHNHLGSGNTAKALSCFERAADLGDGPAALVAGSVLARDPSAADQARRLLLRAAELGEVSAVLRVGVLTSRLGNDDEARKWYLAAIDLGDSEGALNLGLLEHRLGNIAEAKRWLRRAAEDGVARAMRQLGLVAEGEGDLHAAEDWFMKAAEVGYSAAMNDVAVLAIQRGDAELARHWWQRAADAGYQHAAESLARLNSGRRAEGG